jgi:hypothetical protein
METRHAIQREDDAPSVHEEMDFEDEPHITMQPLTIETKTPENIGTLTSVHE